MAVVSHPSCGDWRGTRGGPGRRGKFREQALRHWRARLRISAALSLRCGRKPLVGMRSPGGCLLLAPPAAHRAPRMEGRAAVSCCGTVLSWEENSLWLHRSRFWLTDRGNRGDRRPSAVARKDPGLDLYTGSSAPTLFSVCGGSRNSHLLSLGWSSQRGPSSHRRQP